MMEEQAARPSEFERVVDILRMALWLWIEEQDRHIRWRYGLFNFQVQLFESFNR